MRAAHCGSREGDVTRGQVGEILNRDLLGPSPAVFQEPGVRRPVSLLP
jgi:hypothetical protein